MDEPLPEYVQTLNELTARKAAEWNKQDIQTLVAGFREQSERWNIEQSAGSKKRVTTKQIPVEKKLPTLKLTLSGLKI